MALSRVDWTQIVITNIETAQRATMDLSVKYLSREEWLQSRSTPKPRRASALRLRGGRRLRVHTLPQSNRIELRISGLFLVEIGREEANDFVMLQRFGPCD